jgi:hypothetical protein
MRKNAIGLLSWWHRPSSEPSRLLATRRATNPLGGAAEELCGPCGKLEFGDVGISGNAKLDGFFSAVAKISDASVAINGDFNANIDALSEIYGVANFKADAAIDAKVDALIAKIKADFSANLAGDVKLDYQPAECHASVNVAIQAQAQCEVKGGCDVEVQPGSVEVECEGSCSGLVHGHVRRRAADLRGQGRRHLRGQVRRHLHRRSGAMCEGTCNGKCNGTCSVQNADGSCAGQCEGGTCEGSCELKALQRARAAAPASARSKPARCAKAARLRAVRAPAKARATRTARAR